MPVAPVHCPGGETLIGRAPFVPAALVLSVAEDVSVALVVLLAVLAGLMAYRAWQTARITPEERERQRREALVASGKMGDATLTEAQDGALFYAYIVRGVEYSASQDVSLLTEQVPADLSALAAVQVRYDPRNPANSIVVAERWSGLRLGEQKKLG